MKELQMGPVSISGDIMRIDSETGAICTNKKHWKKWSLEELRAEYDKTMLTATVAFLEHLERMGEQS